MGTVLMPITRRKEGVVFIDVNAVNDLSLSASSGRTDELSISQSLLLLINMDPEKLIARPECFGCAEMRHVNRTILCGLALHAYLIRELGVNEEDADAIVESGSTNAGGKVTRNRMAKCWFEEIE